MTQIKMWVQLLALLMDISYYRDIFQSYTMKHYLSRMDLQCLEPDNFLLALTLPVQTAKLNPATVNTSVNAII